MFVLNIYGLAEAYNPSCWYHILEKGSTVLLLLLLLLLKAEGQRPKQELEVGPLRWPYEHFFRFYKVHPKYNFEKKDRLLPYQTWEAYDIKEQDWQGGIISF